MKKLLCLLLGSLLLLAGCAPHQHTYQNTIIPPTCTEMGYTVHSCACGDTYFSDYRTTATHSFGEWITGVAATPTEGGAEYRTCRNCGYLQNRDTENTSALPKVYLSSGGSVSYSHGELHFTCDSNTRVEEGKPEIQLLFTKNGGLFPVDLGWGEQSAYRLDPCAPDLTYARAAAAEVLWKACLQLRESAGDLPEWSPLLTGGGFPVQVYHDDVYLGLYRLTPPRGDWAYAFPGYEGSSTAVLYSNDHSEECLFLTNPVYDDEGFTLQYFSGESGEWAKKSFEEFSHFIRNSSDEEFKAHLEDHTHVTALLDHFLLLTLFGYGNGDTAGMLWSTADGEHWVPSFSPLHTAYGLTANGAQTAAKEGLSPLSEDGSVVYAGESVLWERLCRVFGEELKTRYTQLRGTVLRSPELLYKSFSQQQQGIEAELLELEKDLQASLAQNAVKSETVSAYIKDRLAAMDVWMGFSR